MKNPRPTQWLVQLEEIMTVEYPNGRRERHPVCRDCRADYQDRAQ